MALEPVLRMDQYAVYCIHFCSHSVFIQIAINTKTTTFFNNYFENRHEMDGVPKAISMLGNGKWSEYSIVFDYEHRRIVLLESKELKVKTLQVGNRKNLSLELNVDIKYYNDFSDVNTNQTKWACLILNHTWHFRMSDTIARDCFANCCSVN
ncbi:hypothetical protein RFI_02025 [Reticulomyxa filosa]|uniref:Uncharacterized protein n=1 Tax=Reticulomyxa filosa TaxID=46433 RepID=X6PA45_RETFI|nr:hypothetical protein RFI_02025 [Reticulomyxa filosa]|eukprot:ETO35051.1 hypothetical protein RFI_02025 [Reticulomyxa filosa]